MAISEINIFLRLVFTQGMSMVFKVKRIIFFTSLSFAIVGCGVPPKKMLSQFNESEMVPYSKVGNSTITGQAFLKTRGGEVRYGAGSWVQLIPSTAYTRELLNYLVNSNGRVENIDGRWRDNVRSIQADGSGNFEFKDVPAGEYLLRCQIYWEVPTGYGLRETGGDILDSVIVGEGQNKKLILTKN